jgi:HSP20 family protein
MFGAWDSVSALDRMLDDVMGSAFGAVTNPRVFQPEIDIRHNENEIVFVCDVPGVKEEDLEVTLENHVLTLKGARKLELSENEKVALGRRYGAFTRSFSLPDYADDDKLSAHLADGVLTIKIPRREEARPRKIQIGGGSAKQLKE